MHNQCRQINTAHALRSVEEHVEPGTQPELGMAV